MRFASRLNSFASRPELFWKELAGKPTPGQMLERAATVKGLTDVDLNFPDHLAGASDREMSARMSDLGLKLNGFAMRYYGDPAYRLGAFTNPDAAIRRRAIDLTKRGIDSLANCGGTLMTLWLGQDGFDYPFQVDYGALWDLEIAGIREVAEHNPDVMISLEYKPNEPRAFSLIGDVGTTLLAIRDVGCPNLGATLDFAHVLYAGEDPGFAAALVARQSRLLGLHLNDAYAKRDDGLMVGAVHTVQTVELLYQLRRDGYQGAIYFDTFPDAGGLDPVAECEGNIATVNAMLETVDRLASNNLFGSAIREQDAVTSQAIVQEAIFGRKARGGR